jgi:hypothetical protein
MIFKKLALETGSYTHEDLPEMRAQFEAMLREGRRACGDLARRAQDLSLRGSRRPSEEVYLDLVFAMAVCHTVQPV